MKMTDKTKINPIHDINLDPTVEEYRIGNLEKKVITNQEEIMKELRQIRKDINKDHEKIIKLEVMYRILNDKFRKQEGYVRAITTTVIAQIILFLFQLFMK